MLTGSVWDSLPSKDRWDKTWRAYVMWKESQNTELSEDSFFFASFWEFTVFSFYLLCLSLDIPKEPQVEW